MQQVTNIQNNSFQSDPFLFPQFIFDNIIKELKPYQFINPSSKEFKLIKDLSLVNIKKSIDKYIYSDNISIRKIVLNNNDTEERIIYIVFGIDLNPNLDIDKKDRKYISKLLSSESDPIINIFNSRLIIFGDIIKKAIIDPVVLFQDNLQDLDNGISSESSLSRYFDILGLELEYRTIKNIFRFIYSDKILSNKESIISNFNVNDIIYNTLYLTLSKQYNNNGICLINSVDQLFKNVVLSINIIKHLDIFEKVKFIMNNSFISDKERFNINLNYLNLKLILNNSKTTLNKNFLELSLLEKALVIFENELEED